MATSSSAIQKKIETLKKGLNNKFITAAQKEKIKAQVQKLESQSKASAPKKATKPAASSSLTRLQKLVKNKKYGVYKGAGVDLKKDSDRPAKAIGKRTSKSGKTYYEYRANRIDVKQPPKKYPKLEQGGYMAKGGVVGEYKVVPNKRGEGKLRMYVTSDYEMAFKITGSKEEAEKAAQKFVKEHNETHPTATVTKIHPSGQAIKNKNVSYVTKDEIAKFEDGGYMADGAKLDTMEQVMTFEEFKKKLPILHDIKAGDNGVEYKPKYNKYSGTLMYFKNGRTNSEKVSLSEAYKHYKYFLEKGEEYAHGGRVKGRNNETGETYGVVIGSVKKSDENIEGGTEMNVRKGYSSRISEVKLVFDKNGNLYEITDYGYGLEGNYPDTSRGSGRNYNADKKETLEVLSKKYNPAFAKKLIELAKNPKMAEGGMTEHGLRIGDKITTDMFWDNQIVVENTKTNKRAQIDLETGKRKDEMEKGGYMAKGGEVGDFFYDSRKDKAFVVIFEDGAKMGIQYLGKDKKPIGEIEKISKNEFEYNVEKGSWGKWKQAYEKGGYMAKGGLTEKEVVESNADMVLSQIKAVKHHAEELSSVVSRKSNIEAWVVGKIERASTDLSDITHYLEGNKDKMSMGGTVRNYAHKMDKK
jgi:hypothetical protein